MGWRGCRISILTVANCTGAFSYLFCVGSFVRLYWGPPISKNAPRSSSVAEDMRLYYFVWSGPLVTGAPCPELPAPAARLPASCLAISSSTVRDHIAERYAEIFVPYSELGKVNALRSLFLSFYACVRIFSPTLFTTNNSFFLNTESRNCMNA